MYCTPPNSDNSGPMIWRYLMIGKLNRKKSQKETTAALHCHRPWSLGWCWGARDMDRDTCGPDLGLEACFPHEYGPGHSIRSPEMYPVQAWWADHCTNWWTSSKHAHCVLAYSGWCALGSKPIIAVVWSCLWFQKQLLTSFWVSSDFCHYSVPTFFAFCVLPR